LSHSFGHIVRKQIGQKGKIGNHFFFPAHVYKEGEGNKKKESKKRKQGTNNEAARKKTQKNTIFRIEEGEGKDKKLGKKNPLKWMITKKLTW
jgi:hypothetical protein